MAKWGKDRFERLQEARADTGAKRLALAAQLRQAADRQAERAALETAKAKRFADVDLDAALAFAATIPFQRFDLAFEDAGTLNRPTLELLRHFLIALVEQKSAAVLQWPTAQRDTAILHPLAMLALLGSRAATVTGGHRWCPAVHDMRTLYFPWRGGGTGSDQRAWLVNRDRILTPNALHRTRGLAGQLEATEPLGMLHDMLGHLTRLKLRDASLPHLAHPTLAELFSVFSADGAADAKPMFAAARHELFGRVRHGAAIDRLTDHRATLTNSQLAPFALFGIDARANFRTALSASALVAAKSGRPPDLCLLDLNPPRAEPARPGLGRDDRSIRRGAARPVPGDADSRDHA